MFDYPVLLEPQPEGGYVVTFPDVPEAVTQGEDPDEALLYAVDALETALTFYVADHKPLPIPSPPEGRPTVRPTPLECELASLSWLAGSPEAALAGIRRMVAETLAEMDTSGEPAPVPQAERHYSVPQAPEQGVSLNRLASAKLAA